MTAKWRRMAAALVLGGTVVAAGWGLWTVRPVLAPFLMAIVIAYLLAPAVNALANRGMRRLWAILAVYAVVSAVIGLGIWKLLPQAIVETRKLADNIPAYSLRARQVVDGLQQQVRDMGIPPGLRESLNRSITEVEVTSVALLGSLLDISSLQQAAGFLLSLLLAPFLAIYLLKDLDRFKERFVLAIPARYRSEVLALLRGLDRVLAGFVRGQVLLALAVGVVAALTTHLLGLRYAVLLGIWAGLMEFIPYVGPILGAIPAVMAGLTHSPLLALQVAVAFAIIQQLENAVLSPKILGESIGLHPLTVMLSVLAGGYLWGGWGLILALPAVGLAKELWCFVIARLTERPMERKGPA